MNYAELIFTCVFLALFCGIVYSWETTLVSESENFIFFMRCYLLYMVIDSF